MVRMLSEFSFSSCRPTNSLWTIICWTTILSACVHADAYVEENRTLKSVNAAFERNKQDIYEVYSKALRSKADLRGRAMFRITIDSNGRVAEVSVAQATLDDNAVLRQVSGIIARMDFGKVRRAGSVVVTYPIDFLPKKE